MPVEVNIELRLLPKEVQASKLYFDGALCQSKYLFYSRVEPSIAHRSRGAAGAAVGATPTS